jgi:signal transduction histidine kinase
MAREIWAIDQGDLFPIDLLQGLCSMLDEFALPSAIIDFERHSFVAWNSSFLEHTGFSQDGLKSSNPEDLLTFGDLWLPLSAEEEEESVEYVSCSAKLPSGTDHASGYTVRLQGKLGYVVLNIFDSAAARFEQGREEERNRIMRELHDEVSPRMIAALFLMHRAKIELKDAGLPQAETVSKASDILTATTEKIVEVVAAEERKPE